MTTKKKSWVEKLHQSKNLPKIDKVKNEKMAKWGARVGDTFVVPRPLDVDYVMKKVPKGKLITVSEIRQELAKKYKTTICCPLTVGIFTWISANAADEEMAAGKKRITPYWRTLKSDGYINEKYPGGVAIQKKLMEAEGHKVIKKGKKSFVSDYEKSLMRL